jgi:hypothetical protein
MSSDSSSDHNKNQDSNAGDPEYTYEELQQMVAMKRARYLSLASQTKIADLGIEFYGLDEEEITPEMVSYLIDMYPYIQMVSSGNAKSFDRVKIDSCKDGWDICNYGDSMSSSPGKYLFGMGEGPAENDEDDDGEGGAGLDVGTLVRQRYMTVQHMIALAIEQGWASVHVHDGHPLMMRDAWIEGQRQGIAVSGFEPTKRDAVVLDRINMSKDALDVIVSAASKAGKSR